MVWQAEDFDRHAIDLYLGATALQHCVDLGAPAQPRLDLACLRVVVRREIHIRREPPVEPGQERAAKGFHHGGDADIDREREQ